jgi:hypothetical protein
MHEWGRAAGDETAARAGDLTAVPGKHAIVLTKPTIRTDHREAVYPDFAVPSCNLRYPSCLVVPPPGGVKSA